MTWDEHGRRAGAPSEVARAARYYMVAQVENGHMCPVTMTRAGVAALAAAPALLARVMPKIDSRQYESEFRSWSDKSGVTIGMGMTEKQGGTDVRANTTRAEPDGEGYRITGHKWFMSAPMSDAFLVLAQAPGGLTCFFMPRFTPEGAVNALRFQRLKDKLGNRSNASSEVEFARNGCCFRISASLASSRARDRIRWLDAHGLGASGASCAPPLRFQACARRSAADAHGAR